MSEAPPPEPEDDSPIIVQTTWARASLHIAWAVAAIALALIGLRYLSGLGDVVESGGEKTVEIVEALLQRKVEIVMSTSIANMRGAGQAFHVAYTFGGDKTFTRSEEVKTLFNIPLGKPSTTVHWSYTVDLGIDLSQVGAAGFAPACDETTFRCTLTLPDPTHRPPAIDTSTIQVDQEGAALVWGGIEDAQKDEALRQLTQLTVDEVSSPGFWGVNREAVRANLRDWAEERYKAQSAPGEPAVAFDVVFASEANGQAEATTTLQAETPLED